MVLRALLKTLALPPGLNILLILLALLLLGSRPRLRNSVIFLSIISLALLATPMCAHLLARQLEQFPALNAAMIDASQYQAILVLGAGRYRDMPEYGGDTPNALGLERLRYGAYLQRKTGLPMMVLGGKWGDDKVSEADFMESVIEREFLGSVMWREDQSRNTWENARLAKQIAERERIQRVLLVTHAWHMPRAVYSFNQAGLAVTPAPTGFRSHDRGDPKFMDYVPQANALFYSSLMLHEILGLAWYQTTEIRAQLWP